MRLDTPDCDFGWQAPDFTLKNPAGQSYRMADYLGEKGLLIAFICNHCPYVKRIAKHFSQDAKTLIQEGINVLAIMSNDYQAYPDDAPEHMLKFAQQYDFVFPYLIDDDQSVAKQYGAICTPDFFGFNHQGELQYRGRLDNTTVNESNNRVPELLNAMRQIAQTGKGPKEQYASMGCSIKWR